MPPVLAFDLGNVIFDFDYTLALEKIKGEVNATMDEILHALYVEDFALPFEKGLLSGPQFYEQFKTKFSSRLSYKEFVDVWCKIFFPNPEMVELLKHLKDRYPLYLVSNINHLHFEYLYSQHPGIFSLFEDLILSFKVKSVKPEREIYEALRQTSGVAPRDIIYIDDRKELITAASSFGLTCIHFQGYHHLLRDLSKAGISILL
jgi:putative hydrolase of the HAD superfamily